MDLNVYGLKKKNLRREKEKKTQNYIPVEDCTGWFPVCVFCLDDGIKKNKTKNRTINFFFPSPKKKFLHLLSIFFFL